MPAVGSSVCQDRASATRSEVAIGMPYKAFISYRHHVLPTFVRRLELALKTYAKPLLRPPITIFRDENHLAPGIDLAALINAALESSEFLILLASPESARSPWVQREVTRWFGHLQRADTFIVVLLSGSIGVTDDGLVDWARTDALPDCLRPHLTGVPLFVDMRWAVDDEGLDLAHPEFRRSVNAIVARMRGIDPNELLGVEVRQHRRNLRLRNVAVSLLAALTVISMAGLSFALSQRQAAVAQRNEAERQRANAVMTTAAVEIEQGRLNEARTLVAGDAGLSPTFKDNVTWSALDEGAVLDVGKDFSPSDENDAFDVDQLALSPDGSFLLAQGWYNGIHIVDLKKTRQPAWCGMRSRFSLSAIGRQGRVLGYSNGTHVAWASVETCAEEASLDLERDAGGNDPITAVAVVKGEAPLLFGDRFGRLSALEVQQGSVVRTFPSGIEAILPWGDEESVAVLTKGARLALVSVSGDDVGPTLRLSVGKSVTTTSPAWARFARSRAPRERAVVVTLPIGTGADNTRQEAIVAFDVDAEGVTSIAFVRAPVILAARVNLQWDEHCMAVEWITSDAWHRIPIDTRCSEELAWEEVALPATAQAAAFCGPTFPFVLAGVDNRVLWARVTGNMRVTAEHVEQSWPDAIRSVVCADDGTAYAGFRVTGIRKYRPPFEVVTERLDAAPASAMAAEPAASAEASASGESADSTESTGDDDEIEDQPLTRPIRGGQTVRLQGASGIVELIGPSGAIWSRKVAHTEPYRTGMSIDRVEAFRVDEPRARVWALRSFGELMLLDLHTGTVLGSFGTNLLTAGPATPRLLHTFDLHPVSGEPEFLHTNGDVWWRVRVQPRRLPPPAAAPAAAPSVAPVTAPAAQIGGAAATHAAGRP